MPNAGQNIPAVMALTVNIRNFSVSAPPFLSSSRRPSLRCKASHITLKWLEAAICNSIASPASPTANGASNNTILNSTGHQLKSIISSLVQYLAYLFPKELTELPNTEGRCADYCYCAGGPPPWSKSTDCFDGKLSDSSTGHTSRDPPCKTTRFGKPDTFTLFGPSRTCCIWPTANPSVHARSKLTNRYRKAMHARLTDMQ